MNLPWFLSDIGPAAMLNEQRRVSVSHSSPASSCLWGRPGSEAE